VPPVDEDAFDIVTTVTGLLTVKGENIIPVKAELFAIADSGAPTYIEGLMYPIPIVGAYKGLILKEVVAEKLELIAFEEYDDESDAVANVYEAVKD
jgi:hypothetical protein